MILPPQKEAGESSQHPFEHDFASAEEPGCCSIPLSMICLRSIPLSMILPPQKSLLQHPFEHDFASVEGGGVSLLQHPFEHDFASSQIASLIWVAGESS